MSLFEELKRRNVFRVAIAYAVAAWLLLQLTEVLSGLLDLQSDIGKIVVILLVVGFVPTVIFAWAFELTPEGVKREQDVDRTQSIAPQTGKKLDRVIIAGLVTVILAMAIERAWFAGRESPPAQPAVAAMGSQPAQVDQAKTVAVLPFADLSQEQDQGWFADGLAEEILNALARAPDLLVSSRTSSFAYKGSSAPIVQIATELGVAHVLEGSVRRAGDRIRVTAQLIRASDGFHVWSENYDRKTDDVIAIQEELAVSIAQALKTTMDPESLAQMLSAGTRSVEAYEIYLTGLSLAARSWEEPGFESYLKAYDAFEQARSIDPGFSAAHAAAAYFWRDQISISRRSSGLTDTSPEAKMAAFRERISAAIDTAGNEIERLRHQALLALIEMRVRDAITLSRQVLQARPFEDPTNDVLLTAAAIAGDTEALKFGFDRAYSQRDRGPEWARETATYYYRMKFSGFDPGVDLDAWLSEAGKRSGEPSVTYQAQRTLLWLGKTAEAAELLPFLARYDGHARMLVEVRQACAEGRRSDAERILQQALAIRTNGQLRDSTLWHVYKLLGRSEDAIAVLKPYESMASPLTLGAYLGYPDFDPAPFPVLMSIMQREGIAYRKAARVPFTCPEQDRVQQESVAVLPFTAMSSGEDDEYFADGLTEEILNSLAGLPELLVTARTSSFHFKGQDLPIPEIARALGVAHVVEGSVRRAGERVRITAQLIRAEDGFHLWSNTYDRTLEDIFAVQEDIANNIAETLDVVLDEGKRQKMRDAGIGDVEAFIAYQKALQLFFKAHLDIENVEESLAQADPYFQEALEAAPDLAAARVLKADAAGHVIFSTTGGLRPERFPGEGQQTLEALRAEYDLAWRSTAPGNQRDILDVERSLFHEDWTGLGAKLDLALRPGKCAETNWTTELATGVAQRPAIVEKNLSRLRCDPLNPVALFTLSMTLLWNGQHEAALQAIKDAEDSGISFEWLNTIKAMVRLASGELDHPDTGLLSAAGGWMRFPREILLMARKGDLDQARATIADFEKIDGAGDDWSGVSLAAMTGDREAANRHAARIDARPGGSLVLTNIVYVCACGAPFDLEATPNYQRKLAEAGFSWPPPTVIHYPAKDW